MAVLILILKLAVITVLAASLAEALVLSWRHARHGAAAYDWKAAGISVVEFSHWRALWQDLRAQLGREPA